MGDVIIDGNTGANRLVILDANGKIPALDGSNVTLLAGANFSTGTIPVARIDTGTAAGKVVKLDGNAKLPAVSGAALTGVVGATKNASNPVIATNPSGGVGTEWQNTTTGEIFICTDATAGANVWTSTGGRSGNIVPFHGYGLIAGFASGGPNTSATIDKISFASDGDATGHGDMSEAKNRSAGQSSETHGYASGGYRASGGPARFDNIDKFAFASNTTGADVGDLSVGRRTPSGQSSETQGFSSGGNNSPDGEVNTIDKFTFATDGNATDVGDLTTTRTHTMGQNSVTYGYVSGGSTPNPGHDKIEKFAFASNGNATDIADLTVGRYAGAGHSSETYGFNSGGQEGTPTSNIIDKFPFASDSDATDHGDLYVAVKYVGGSSALTYGYTFGAETSPNLNQISKFAYASNTTGSDVGNLRIDKYLPGGNNQY